MPGCSTRRRRRGSGGPGAAARLQGRQVGGQQQASPAGRAPTQWPSSTGRRPSWWTPAGCMHSRRGGAEDEGREQRRLAPPSPSPANGGKQAAALANSLAAPTSMTTKGAMPASARMLHATVRRPRAVDRIWRSDRCVSSSCGRGIQRGPEASTAGHAAEAHQRNSAAPQQQWKPRWSSGKAQQRHLPGTPQ